MPKRSKVLFKKNYQTKQYLTYQIKAKNCVQMFWQANIPAKIDCVQMCLSRSNPFVSNIIEILFNLIRRYDLNHFSCIFPTTYSWFLVLIFSNIIFFPSSEIFKIVSSFLRMFKKIIRYLINTNYYIGMSEQPFDCCQAISSHVFIPILTNSCMQLKSTEIPFFGTKTLSLR
jgi:hypothetical protein